MEHGELHKEIAEAWRQHQLDVQIKRGKGRKHRVFVVEYIVQRLGWNPSWFYGEEGEQNERD